MFNGEPSSAVTSSNPGTLGSLQYSLVLSMGTVTAQGISTKVFQAVHPDPSALSSLNTQLSSSSQYSSYFTQVPTIDSYGPMFFQQAFVSTYHLVKIYKIDYTPLSMLGNLNITAAHLYTNGTAIITAKNIGGSSTPPIPFNYYTAACA